MPLDAIYLLKYLTSAEPFPFVQVHRGFDSLVSVETFLLLQHYSEVDCAH